ncbi:unnamed protein product, partial [marine sediment metagenome]
GTLIHVYDMILNISDSSDTFFYYWSVDSFPGLDDYYFTIIAHDNSSNLALETRYFNIIDIIPYGYTKEMEASWHSSSHSYSDWCYDIAIDSLGNIYLVGTDAINWGDICLVKLDSSGNYQWNRIWSGYTDSATAVAIDSLDNVYVLGKTDVNDRGNYDVVLLKYNNLGILQWQRFWGGSEWEYAESLAIDSNDNIYVVGNTRSYGEGGPDILLLK